MNISIYHCQPRMVSVKFNVFKLLALAFGPRPEPRTRSLRSSCWRQHRWVVPSSSATPPSTESRSCRTLPSGTSASNRNTHLRTDSLEPSRPGKTSPSLCLTIDRETDSERQGLWSLTSKHFCIIAKNIQVYLYFPNRNNFKIESFQLRWNFPKKYLVSIYRCVFKHDHTTVLWRSIKYSLYSLCMFYRVKEITWQLTK